jgi:hypothetical protein
MYMRVARAEAETLGLIRGRSLKCSGWEGTAPAKHAYARPDGCANDGSGCLCECHDPKDES